MENDRKEWPAEMAAWEEWDELEKPDPLPFTLLDHLIVMGLAIMSGLATGALLLAAFMLIKNGFGL